MGRKKKKNKKEEEEISEETQEKKPRRNIAGDIKRSIAAVALFVLAILSMLGFFGSAGSFGSFLDKAISIVIGWVKFIFPIFLIISGIVLLLRKETSFYVAKLLGLGTALLGLTGIFHWFFDPKNFLSAAREGTGGGFVGYILDFFLVKYLGSAGSFVVLLALILLGAILAFNFSLHELLSLFKKNEEEAEGEPGEEMDQISNVQPKEEIGGAQIQNIPGPSIAEPASSEEDMAEKNIGRIEFEEDHERPTLSLMGEGEGESEESDFSQEQILSSRSIDSGVPSKKLSKTRRTKRSKWNYPDPDLLERSSGSPMGGNIEKNSAIIQKTLEDFGIKVEKGGVKTGPAVTQYSFRPAVGVKVSKIMSLQNDLALALAARSIRIEAPIPGQSLIGIEIPNEESLIVRLRDMIDDLKFRRRKGDMTLALGQDVSGENIFSDLSKMPHLMIAGATGTGKSVCINSIITTLLYQNSPDDLKFIMVDPKRVELSLYNGIPHLLTKDVVVENGKVVNTLKWAVSEMERRYRLFQDIKARDMDSYREKLRNRETIRHIDPESGEVTEEKLKNLPYIVIIIDELADLMGSHGKEVEGAIVRIAQMARAVGIHLIVSTQRPSVEVITGLIKANITTRIAFQVATQIDSRTILDMGGAEKLLGNGDMLYLSSSSPKPRRIQGVFVSESEVKRVVEFIKENNETEEEEDENESTENITEDRQKEILEFKADNLDENGSDGELLKAAEEEIVRSKKASASFLQRRLRIGYARAARILDMLEEKGVVGPANGAKPREIYVGSEKQTVNYEDNIEDQEKRDKWQM